MAGTDKHRVIIIGAGLSGLAIAYYLKKAGIPTLVLEARPRIGGRIHTLHAAKQEEKHAAKHPDKLATVEMGATWLWPHHEHLGQLLAELGLSFFEQPIGSQALYDLRPQGGAGWHKLPPNNDPSYRVTGGSGQLPEKLMEALDPGTVRLGQEVTGLTYGGEPLHPHITLNTPSQDFTATHVVCTLPPNLWASHLSFAPALPPELMALAKQTHTWMGESIKVALRFAQPFWQAKGLSGTIFSNQGPITEMYDHSPPNGQGYALMGFFNPMLANASRAERQQAALQQLTHYFGPIVHETNLGYEETVWRNEPYTFVPYEGAVQPHQNNGHAAFRQGQWNGQLWFAGAETATQHPGYMNGAIASAQDTAGRLVEALRLTAKG